MRVDRWRRAILVVSVAVVVTLLILPIIVVIPMGFTEAQS